jgi:hypothetical protein
MKEHANSKALRGLSPLSLFQRERCSALPLLALHLRRRFRQGEAVAAAHRISAAVTLRDTDIFSRSSADLALVGRLRAAADIVG